MAPDGNLMRGFANYKTSALVLIVANALPLLGVLFLGWDTFSIIVLYWVENVIIGAINILKMIAADPDPDAIDWSKLAPAGQTAQSKSDRMELSSLAEKSRLANHLSKLFLVPFFAFHYGFFCLGHGFFVLALFGHDSMDVGLFAPLRGFRQVLSENHLWWCVVALAASHLCSFFVNFLGRGEYRRTFAPLLMVQPYSRIVILHVAIIFGGFFAMALGSNAGVLMIVIIGKTILDLSLHLRERDRNAPAQSRQQPIMPETIVDEAGQPHPIPAALAQSRPPAHSSSDD